MKRLILAAAAILTAACSQTVPVLEVEGGKIQGIASAAEGVTVFRGVPYAAAPVGDLRWKAPQPVPAWDGVKVADTFGLIAPQKGNPPGTFYGNEFYWEGTPDMSEDCLYLNVWAPTNTLGKTDAKLPVAMWVHGGAYTNGYGYEVTMDGDAWAKKGVILVTINYRLGLLGFLSHPALSEENGGYSGNYGTLDQIKALQWVHEYISQFGGDPDNITVFGQSAGAMSVKTLVASPGSKGLMSKAIIQSGGGLSIGSLMPTSGISQETYDARGKAMMDHAGLETIEQMRAASWQELMAAMDKYSAETRSYVSLGPHDSPDITADFNRAVQEGTVADVPYMIGYNLNDMGMLGGKSVDYFCDFRTANSKQPVFEYEFLRNLPGDDDDPEKDPGAFHSAELWYTFGTLAKSWRPFTEADYALSEEMVTAWTDFCKTGNPGWNPYTSENPFMKEFQVK